MKRFVSIHVLLQCLIMFIFFAHTSQAFDGAYQNCIEARTRQHDLATESCRNSNFLSSSQDACIAQVDNNFYNGSEKTKCSDEYNQRVGRQTESVDSPDSSYTTVQPKSGKNCFQGNACVNDDPVLKGARSPESISAPPNSAPPPAPAAVAATPQEVAKPSVTKDVGKNDTCDEAAKAATNTKVAELLDQQKELCKGKSEFSNSCSNTKGIINSCTEKCDQSCLDGSGALASLEEKMREDKTANKDKEDGSDKKTNTAGTCDEQYEAAYKQCKDTAETAQNCCSGGALGCAFGGDGKGTMAAVGAAGTMLLNMAATQPSLVKECSTYKKLGGLSAGLNGAVAGVCQMKRSSCNSACEEGGTVAQAIDDIRKAHAEDLDCQREAKTYITRLELQKNKCDNLISNEIQMAGQAAQAIMASKMAELCKNTVVPISPPIPPPVANDWCRSEKDLSNPYCRDILCSQPAYATNPICKNGGVDVADKGTPSGGGGGGSFSGGGFGSRKAAGTGSGDDAEQQAPNTGGNITPQDNKVILGDNKGGGGGLPGAGGSGGGGQGSNGGAGRGGAGYNTDILKGLSSGSGYTVSAGEYDSGGGFSNSGARGAGKEEGKKFNLKDFLPGEKHGRNIAGLEGSGIHGQIAGKFDSVFIRVSNKYREMCILDRLECKK